MVCINLTFSLLFKGGVQEYPIPIILGSHQASWPLTGHKAVSRRCIVRTVRALAATAVWLCCILWQHDPWLLFGRRYSKKNWPLLVLKRCWKGSVNLLLMCTVLKIERKMSFVPTLPFAAKSRGLGNVVIMISGHVFGHNLNLYYWLRDRGKKSFVPWQCRSFSKELSSAEVRMHLLY